jgi:hypothetical protein
MPWSKKSMPERMQWTEDRCTCGHTVSHHRGGDGRCLECDNQRTWAPGGIVLGGSCLRFQWDGEPRRRAW